MTLNEVGDASLQPYLQHFYIDLKLSSSGEVRQLKPRIKQELEEQVEAEAQLEETDRFLVATRHYQPGDVIFSESTPLHSRHPLGSTFRPVAVDELREIPPDYQRLIYVWLRLLAQADCTAEGIVKLKIENNKIPNAKKIKLAKEGQERTQTNAKGRKPGERNKNGVSAAWLAYRCLTADGVESVIAQRCDVDRRPDYMRGSQKWAAKWGDSAERVYRMCCLLETNSHSRGDLPSPSTAEALERIRKDSELDSDVIANKVSCTNLDPSYCLEDEGGYEKEDEEEWLGIWVVGSLLQHACLPNAQVIMTSYPPSGSKVRGLDVGVTATHGFRDHAYLTARACRSIAPGDCIAISYTDQIFRPLHERQARLRRRRFICSCLLCRSGTIGCSLPEWSLTCLGGLCSSCGRGMLRTYDAYQGPQWCCDHCLTRCLLPTPSFEADSTRWCSLLSQLVTSMRDWSMRHPAPHDREAGGDASSLGFCDWLQELCMGVLAQIGELFPSSDIREWCQFKFQSRIAQLLYGELFSQEEDDSDDDVHADLLTHKREWAPWLTLWMAAWTLRMTRHVAIPYATTDLEHHLYWTASVWQPDQVRDGMLPWQYEQVAAIRRGAARTCRHVRRLLYGEEDVSGWTRDLVELESM